ncbi:MAG: Hsp70 family protein [Luteolibacter sp.]
MLWRMAEMILGIDLGTTNSAVGVVDSGFPILLANEEGKRITPSAVWIGTAGEIEVGDRALRRRATDPQRVVTSIKRLIGRRLDEIEDDFPLPVERGPDGLPRVLGRTPEEISAEILRELKRIAEWRLEREVAKAVVTVPAYFNDAQRSATKRAGEMAGLEVVRIVNEPTAAALAYGLDKLGESSRVAVYDLGGGTFDLSILQLHEGVFEVLATHGDTRLGGDDLDMRLLQAHAPGLDPARWLAEAARVKCALSEVETATFRAPFHDGAQSMEVEVTRSMLVREAAPWIRRTLDHARRALADAAIAPMDLDAVILVGGSTRIPAVQRAVAEFFGREPDVSQHPDEAIALGATIQAGILSGAMQRMVLLDVTPLSLGIETYGGLMNVLIPRNSTIPCKAGEMFTNAADGQRAMRVRVLQGEREMASDNWELGRFNVEFDAAPKGRARVGVQFRIDENGILEVLARDTQTGRDTVVNLDNAAVNVDDADVEKMVGESVEHAFEDMAARVFTEAKLKADELLPAVDAVLATGLVDDSERAEIQAAAVAVRAAMESGAAHPLKQAVQQLDRATEAVAARLVEKAMDEALERRLGEI